MILDASVLLAAADRDARHHEACKALLGADGELVVPEPVLVEVDYLILSRLGTGPEIVFLHSLGGPWLSVECPRREDRLRAAEIAERYADARIGYVDAVTTAIAERLGETRIATLDRRHFSFIRPQHTPSFEIVP